MGSWSVVRGFGVALACAALSACMDDRRGAAPDDTGGGDTSMDVGGDVGDATPDVGDARPDANDDAPGDTGLADTASDSAAGDLGPDAGDDAVDAHDGADATGFACACDYGQRCANACLTPGDVCARDGYPDGTERRYCRPAAQVGEGCTNQFDEYYVGCAPDLSCLVPDPVEPDTVSTCHDCGTQEAVGVGGCEVEIGVLWDGARCRTISGCSCEGRDCGALFNSLERCVAATERPCAALGSGR